MKPRFTFSELSPTQQSLLWELRLESCILKGYKNPDKETKRYFSGLRKGKKAWKFLKLVLLQKIDRALMKNGLEPKHFPRKSYTQSKVVH